MFTNGNFLYKVDSHMKANQESDLHYQAVHRNNCITAHAPPMRISEAFVKQHAEEMLIPSMECLSFSSITVKVAFSFVRRVSFTPMTAI